MFHLFEYCQSAVGFWIEFNFLKEKLDWSISNIFLWFSDHVNPNTRSADGGTGLTLAAVGRNQHLVPLLLERGCDPNLVDNIGRTALHWGALSGRDANIRILLSTGKSVENFNGKLASKHYKRLFISDFVWA